MFCSFGPSGLLTIRWVHPLKVLKRGIEGVAAIDQTFTLEHPWIK
jgi:hypothetical protein